MHRNVAGTILPPDRSLSLVKPDRSPTDQERNQHLRAAVCRASWHWAVTVVVGSGKVTTGSSWHPAVTQARRASSEGATVVCWKTTSPHSACPRGFGGLSPTLVPTRPPSKASHPPAVLSPRGGFTVLGGGGRSCCQQGRSQGGGALVAAVGRRVESRRLGDKGTVGQRREQR